MKAYQRVLRNVSRLGMVLGVVAGLYFGITYLTGETEEQEAVSAWCLDNGGRNVKIDGTTGCFALTVVPQDVGFWGSERSECEAEPKYIWHRFSMGAEWRCYSFARVTETAEN